MTYRLVFAQRSICEQDFHINEWEDQFVCKYEMRGREARQIS